MLALPVLQGVCGEVSTDRNQQVPVFEQTINLNDQGVANFFRYDYPDYSLILKLKKINLVNLDCN